MVSEEEQLRDIEEQIDSLDSEGQQSYGSPYPPKKDSTLVLFRELIKAKDSRKFGNLTNRELGETKLAVRHSLNIALYCEAEGILALAEYFENKAEIVAATSMSRKGWFGNLIVTQIRKDKKISASPEPSKGGWFSKKKDEGDNNESV